MSGRRYAVTTDECPWCGGIPARPVNGYHRECWKVVDRVFKRAEDSPYRQLRASEVVTEHGTPAGYAKHRRLGEAPCEECRRAHTIRRKGVPQ